MGKQSRIKQMRKQPNDTDASLRKLQRDMGRKALIIHVQNGGNNDPYEALGSLFSQYVNEQRDEQAKIIGMGAAIMWLMDITGLDQADVIAETNRRAAQWDADMRLAQRADQQPEIGRVLQ